MVRKKIYSTILAGILLLHTALPVMAQSVAVGTDGCKAQENLSYEEFAQEAGQLQAEYDENQNYIPAEPGESAPIDYQTCRLLVKATTGITDKTAEESVGPYNGIYVFQYEDEEAARSASVRLGNLEGVEFVQPDRVYSIPEQENSRSVKSLFQEESGNTLWGVSDSLGLGSDWGADACAFPDMWDLLLEKYGSVEQMPEVTVADLDTGVYYDHECFAGRISEKGYDFVDFDEVASDEHGHGTEVASIITQNTPDNVRVVPLRTFDGDGNYTDLQLYLAVEYAIEQEVDVLNISFGGYGLDGITEEYMSDAVEAGITIVAAYGNYGVETDNIYPACCPGVIGVSAVSKSKVLAGFSCYGAYVDLAAPGESLRAAHISGTSKYATVSGTSFAAPYVAAAVALLKAYEPDSSAAAIAAVLYKNAEDIGVKGWDTFYGYGLVSFDGIQLEDQLTTSTYNIDFITNGGTAVAAQSVLRGEKVVQPSVPVREGYHFLGWYTDRFYFNKYDFNNTVTSNLALYAKWEQHSYSSANAKVVKVPSYSSPGVTEYRCSVCNQVVKTVNSAMLSLGQPSLSTVKNSAKGIKLSWKKISGATGYYIYRKTGNGSWKKIKTVKSGSTVSYTDTAAKNGKTYSYRVCAYNSTQKSGYSAAQKLRRITTPKLSSVKKAKSGIKVKWSKVSSVTGYLVYRKTPNGSWKKIATVKGAKTLFYVDKTAKKGKKYDYRIRAYKKLSGRNYYSAYTGSMRIKR